MFPQLSLLCCIWVEAGHHARAVFDCQCTWEFGWNVRCGMQSVVDWCVPKCLFNLVPGCKLQQRNRPSCRVVSMLYIHISQFEAWPARVVELWAVTIASVLHKLLLIWLAPPENCRLWSQLQGPYMQDFNTASTRVRGMSLRGAKFRYSIMHFPRCGDVGSPHFIWCAYLTDESQ